MTQAAVCVTRLLLTALVSAAATLEKVEDKNVDVESIQPGNAMTMEMKVLDDQYVGCREKMLQKVLGPGGLLEAELQMNPEFRKAWEEGRKCNKTIPGGRWEHGVALAAYTSDYVFHELFNDAVMSLATNHSLYESDFLFKSLHFLLTDLVRLLDRGGGGDQKCQAVDSGSHTNLSQTRMGDVVRLGHFAWGEPNLSRPPCNTLFNIRTCHAALVHEYSCHQNVYLLIPPSEMFTVRVVSPRDKGRVYIALASEGTYTRQECLHFRGAALSSNPPSMAATIGVVVTLLVILLCLAVALSVSNFKPVCCSV